MNTIKISLLSLLLSSVLMAENINELDQGREAFIQKDYASALTIFSELASKGDVKAQYYSAGMYEFGQGVDKDDTQALFWYEKAAEQGMREAQRTVAFRYEFGIGTKADQKMAAYWYEKSKRTASDKERVTLTQWFDPRNTFEVNN